MGLDAHQLREHIVKPALRAVELYSPAAEALVMGTAAQESHLKYVKQLGSGPAVGLFQMERATYADIWVNYLAFNPELKQALYDAIQWGDPDQDFPPASRLMWDMRLAAIMCRIHYLRVKQALPDVADIWAQAAYWKKYYNTPAGAGTEQQFVDNVGKFL